MKRLSLILILLSILITSTVYALPVTRQILYEGTAIVRNGTYSMTFSIYDAETGGNLLFEETESITIGFTRYTHILGSINPLTISFDQQYWLEVRNNTTGQTYARDMFLPDAYSLWSEKTDFAKDADTVDGQHASDFALSNHNHNGTYVVRNEINSISGQMIMLDSILNSHIVDGAVTDAKITGPISGAKLGGHTHDGADIATGTISTSRLNVGTTAGTVAAGEHNHDTVYQTKYAKVAVVAQSGGDYTNPLTAMNNLTTWCGTPSATNPCLLKIMPGIYNIGTNSLQMQSYVDIEGSGENVTKIKGNINSGLYGVVNGASNAEIRFLTVENTGSNNSIGFSNYYNFNNLNTKMTNITINSTGSSYSYGINNVSSSPLMTNVSVNVSGNWYIYGIYSSYNSSPVMTNITVNSTNVANGSLKTGILNQNSSPVMINVTVNIAGGRENRGISNSGGSPIMMNVQINASSDYYGQGGRLSIGVTNNNSNPNMTNVKAAASGGTEAYGVYNDNLSLPAMISVNASASNAINSSYAIYNFNSSPVIKDGIATASGSNTSIGVYATGYSSPVITNLKTTASGETYLDLIGLKTGINSIVKVDHSEITASKYSIINEGTTFIANTKLDGGPISGAVKCIGVYNGNYDPVTCP